MMTTTIDYELLYRIIENGADVEEIIKGADSEAITPVLQILMASKSLTRVLLTQISMCAAENGVDLSTPEGFERVVDSALPLMRGERSNQYHALHIMNQMFNTSSSYDTYTKALEAINIMIYNSSDVLIEDVKKPFHELGVAIIRKLDDALLIHQSSVMEVWEILRGGHLDASRADRTEKYLKMFLQYGLDH